ncbi:MAG: TetR/AcrR family transcriptional regulator [Saccharospirillum sp.]|nr:TetR/AcrR family transcriptional regulator [Saccharospirillum sp.]
MKRARAPEQKLERRQALLDAAAQCFLNNGHRLPSCAEVARSAGVAKGTVYLYFKTKEAIFLALLGHQLVQLLGRLEALAEHPLSDDAGSTTGKRLAQLFLEFSSEQPSFLPLSALLQSVLEQNLDHDTLIAFKLRVAESLHRVGLTLEGHFQLAPGQGSRALLHSYASLVGLWQMVQWPRQLEEVKEAPELAPLKRDLEEEVTWVLERIWRKERD